MKDKFSKIIEKGKETSLTEEEFLYIKASIKKHIDSNPLINNKVPILDTVSTKISVSPYIHSLFLKPKFTFNFFAIIFIIFFGANIASASQRALPGDILYPVKLATENIQTALSFGAKAKAMAELEHLLTRLAEIEKLRENNKLDNQTESKLQKAFIDNSNMTILYINDLKKVDEKESADISTEFQSKLVLYQDKILKISSDTNDYVNFSPALDGVINTLSRFTASSTLEINLNPQRSDLRKREIENQTDVSPKVNQIEEENKFSSFKLLEQSNIEKKIFTNQEESFNDGSNVGSNKNELASSSEVGRAIDIEAKARASTQSHKDPIKINNGAPSLELQGQKSITFPSI